MKTLHNFRLITATVLIALFAGCAGITEANLSDTDVQALDAPAVTADSPVESAEAPGYFHGGDQEEMIDVPPSDDHRNRE